MGRTLTIYINGTSLQIIGVERNSLEGHFDFDDNELEAARSKAIRAVDGLTHATCDWEYREDDERHRVIEDLRDAGLSLVDALSGERRGGRDNVFRGSKRRELVRILQSARYLRCLPDGHLPWEFLYLGPANGVPDLKHFLGAHAVAGRPFTKSSKRKRVSPSSLNTRESLLNRPPKCVDRWFGYAQDMRLRSASSGAELRVFSNLKIPVKRAPHLISGASASAHKLNTLLSKSEWLTHFNSHAVADNPHATTGATSGAIYVTDGFKLDYAGIDNTDLAAGSIIVLNCCSGHTMLHAVKDTVATRFMQKDIATAVATTASIEDGYATRWAGHFYEAFWSGSTVPDSILAARTAMLAEAVPNPSAMLYAYLGNETASLQGLPGGSS